MTAPRLCWRSGRHMHIAECGPLGVGRAIVAATRGGYVWMVDMLPGDIEPVIRGKEPTLQLDLALRAAEEQVEAWPSLIHGAERLT